jgi:hypothetical protein
MRNPGPPFGRAVALFENAVKIDKHCFPAIEHLGSVPRFYVLILRAPTTGCSRALVEAIARVHLKVQVLVGPITR